MANIKQILGFGSDTDDYEDDVEYEEEATEEKAAPLSSRQRFQTKRASRASRNSAPAPSGKRPNFILCKPDDKSAMQAVADDVISGKSVILNLENIQKDTKRIVDFLYGVVYALDGTVKKVAEHTYLIAPGGVDITGEMDNDLEETVF